MPRDIKYTALLFVLQLIARTVLLASLVVLVASE